MKKKKLSPNPEAYKNKNEKNNKNKNKRGKALSHPHAARMPASHTKNFHLLCSMIHLKMGFLGGSDGKESACSVGD